MFRSASPLGGSRTASPRPGNRTPRSGSLAVVDSRGAQGAGGRSLTPTNFALGPGDIGGIGKRDRAIQQLVAEESAALNFLARRGSEAEKESGEEEVFDEEAMANAERELAADAEWKRIQQNTFTRWANEHLKQAEKSISDLETDLSDGLKLIALIEVLSGKRMPRHNKKPNFRSQKLENVSIALEFLEREGVFLVNIDSTDIVDCKLKLILGLIWTLILHYAISMPMWDGPPLGGNADQDQKTPKQRLMDWVKDKMPDCPVNNFTSDWKDGKAVGALVDSVAPGLCPNWEDWDPNRPLENATEAMDLADKWLNVPKLLNPEDLVNPNVDDQSMMTYLSQFPNARLKPGAPLKQKINENKVRAYGPGLEPTGLVANAPANFTVETFGAGDAELVVEVFGPSGENVNCDIVFNNDRKVTYSCSYMPEVEGEFIVNLFWSKRVVPSSPYHVLVEGFAGDASKVTAAGPGLEPEGVVINKPTFFDIYTEGAGRGIPEVIILDPKGKKDSVPLKITPSSENPETYRCEYVATMLGLHSVNVFFAGNPIPKSPFGVKVSPASLPSKVWANGRGLQPNGIRVNETVSFKVYTEGAGEGEVAVKIIGPGGVDLSINQSRKIGDGVTEYTYTPRKQGRHIVMITFANQEIPRSPFEVNVGPVKNSNIKAYGPGLKSGIVNKPARFTVDTCGETGALGFSIEGPSQAKINCQDNGDGSADVDYIPTAEGEYAVHILCDKEDIPGSPYMAQIIPQADFDPDKVKAYGPGLENGVNPKEKTHFTIDASDAGDAPLEVSIVDDLGEYEPEMKQKTEKVFECTYTPRNGQHKQTVLVNFGGVAVPGSPFHVLNDNPNDPSLVKVYGPGVEKGVCAGKPVEFTVDCTKSGPGHVNVNIMSAKRNTVPVSIVDNKDDTYTVTYEATDAGPQKIVITLDDTEIPQSPIRIDIKPAVDLKKISLIEFEPEAFVDCINDFTVDTSGLPADQRADIECDITGPDGSPVDSFVNKMGPDGPYQISYTPCEVGDHEIDLRHEGKPLPDSPFPVTAKRGNNSDKVKAYGDGLEKGIVDENNYFTIETKNAGTGGLGLAMEGPSEATVQCVDNQDGSCTVDYVPTEEGDYDITIKFGDVHIPGSPFRVPCVTRDGKPKPNASKVDAYGPGLDPESVFPGKPTHFIVDASKTGEAPVDVTIEDGDGIPIQNLRKPSITNKGEGIYDVSYVPPPVGDPYDVSVKYGGVDIPGSPFEMTSSPDLKDVVGDVNKNRSGMNSRKGSELSPERSYHKNGTGLMRDGSIDDGIAGGSRKSSSNPDDRKGSNRNNPSDGLHGNLGKRGSRSGASRMDPAIEEIVHDESRRGSKAGGRAGIAGIDGAGLRRGSELGSHINDESDDTFGDNGNNGNGQGFKKYSSTENELDSRKSSLAYSSVESRKSSTLSVMSSINYNDDGMSSRKASEFDLGSGGIGAQSRKGSGMPGSNNALGDYDNARKGSQGKDGTNDGANDGRGQFGSDSRKASLLNSGGSRKGSQLQPGDDGYEGGPYGSNSRKGSQRNDGTNDGINDGRGPFGSDSRKGSLLNAGGSRKGSQLQPGDEGYEGGPYGLNSRKGSQRNDGINDGANDGKGQFGSDSRKASLLNSGGSRKGSQLQPGDDGYEGGPYGSNSRKGSKFNEDDDPLGRDGNRKGSYGPDSRKGSNISGIGDPRKGSKYGDDMDLSGRNGSGKKDSYLGGIGVVDTRGLRGVDDTSDSDIYGDENSIRDPNYRRGPNDFGSDSRKSSDMTSSDGDLYGPDGRRKHTGTSSEDNDYGPDGMRKGSRYGPGLDSMGYDSRKGSDGRGYGNDMDRSPYDGLGSRKGSEFGRGDLNSDRDPNGRDNRKGSNNDDLSHGKYGDQGADRKGSNFGPNRSRSMYSDDGSDMDGDIQDSGDPRKGSKYGGPKLSGLGHGNPDNLDDANRRKGSGLDGGTNNGREHGFDGPEGDRKGSKLSGPGRGTSNDNDIPGSRKGSRDLLGDGSRKGSRDLLGNGSRKGSGVNDSYSGLPSNLDNTEGDRIGSKYSGLGRPNSGDLGEDGYRKGSRGPHDGAHGDFDGLGDNDRAGYGRGGSGELNDPHSSKPSGFDSPRADGQGELGGADGDRRGSKLSGLSKGNIPDNENNNYRKGSGNGFEDKPAFGTDSSRKGSKISGINNGQTKSTDNYNDNDPHSRKGSNLHGDESDADLARRKGSGKNSAIYPPLELNNIPLPRTGGQVTADIKTPSYRKNGNSMGQTCDSRKSSYGPDDSRKGSFGDPNSSAYGSSGPDSRKSSGSVGKGGGLGSRKGTNASDGRGYDVDSPHPNGVRGNGNGMDSRKGSSSDSRYPNADSRKGSNLDKRGVGPDSQKLSNASSIGNENGYRKGSDSDGRNSAPDSRKSSNLYGNGADLDHPKLTDNGNGSVGVFYQPEEEGLHLLDIKQDGEHVQGSPYKFHVSPMDDGKVHAMGAGLVHAVCGDPANFVISTKGAGAGGLSLAVEGPSKAEINCQDNKDGTVNVSYLPTAPGEYKIYAKFADEHIDGSPFTCKVTGEGTKRNTISVGSSSDLSLPENLSDYDLRALNAYIVSPSGVEEPCFLKKLPKGNNGISFTPREVGEHLVSVKRNGKHIKNSPFKIMVSRDDVGDASRVKVDGESLKEGRTQQDNTFTVDTKNAGYGGLSLSVEGPSKAEIKCKDNEDGTLEVSYKPTEPGLYIVNLKFADQHIPGSPFAVAVSGEGSEKQTENINRLREAVPITEVGSQCRLTFKMPGISCSDLRASVTAPTGKVESAVVAELEDGLYAVNFVPYELGIHTVSVMYRDVDIPGSPFQFTVGPLQDGGAHRVHAGGPGLERGIQGQAADFNVWTREAGHGSLAISVEGPSKAEVDFNDRKDGSCHVSYVVEEPGEYSVGIRFNDTHIPGSPYKVCILPSAEEAERVRLSGFNVTDTPVSTDMPQTMLLNMNGAGGDVECKLVSPSGREDDCFITPLGTPGEHSVRFVPQEEGVHYLHAKLNGIHIPGSPFKLVVSNLTNMMNNNHGDPSSTVSVHGKGISGGVTGHASIFTIDTSDVGAGTLAITVDGPSKVDLSCNEVDDGYEVAYTPMVPGKYFVTVKYNGKNINGSPFSVQIAGDNLNSSLREERTQRQQSKRSSVTMETMSRTSYVRHQYSESRRGTIQGTHTTNINNNNNNNNMLSSSMSYDRRRSSAIPEFGNSRAFDVKCSGSGIENAKANRHNSFSVDCSKAGNNILYVGVYGPETPCEEVVIKHKGSKRYSVDYVVRERGQYIIFVKWGDEHVAGSPFHIEAN